MSAHTFEYYEPVGYYQRGPIEDRVAEQLGKHMYVSEPRPPPEKCTPRENKVQIITPGYAGWPVGELVYFAVRGRAEGIRLILHYAGLPYTLRNVDFSEWPTLKPTVAGGCLPAFTPDEGEQFSETIDVAKYVAKISGMPSLLGADAAAAEKVYAVTVAGAVPDMNPLLNLTPQDECKSKGPALAAQVIQSLKTVEVELTKSGGPFFGGKSPHYGDFGVWAAVDQLSKLDPSALDKLGAPWKAQFDAVASFKTVKVYLASRPAAGSGKLGAPGSLLHDVAVDPPPDKPRDYETVS